MVQQKIISNKIQVIKTQIIRGPNLWSIKRTKLIQMTVNLGRYELLPTNKIEGFVERLIALIPSLFTHRCSEGVDGGFINRMKEGTWLGHVIEHVALELQCLAGMSCGFGRTRSTGLEGVYHVVYSYKEESAGKLAGEEAVAVVLAISENKPYDLQSTIHKLEMAYNKEKLGPSTQAIVDEASRRGIPSTRLNSESLVMLGYGKNQRRICATTTDSTSSIAVELVQNKYECKRILQEAYIPVPEGIVIENLNQMEDALKKFEYPLVFKPIDGNHGRGITTQVASYAQALIAFEKAQKISSEVLMERYIPGDDYRILLVDYKVVAAAKRTPAYIIGDGKHTVKELIAIENKNPSRGNGHENILTKIRIDDSLIQLIRLSNYNLKSILPMGNQLILKNTANLSSGGTAEDVTDSLHSDIIFLSERTARLMNLNICGIDLIAHDISKPASSENGVILEVNAAPGFRMHQMPSKGTPRNPAANILDSLFTNKNSARIPIVAITGTNGKTTTTTLLAHLAKKTGHYVGFTTSEGIFLDNQQIVKGDCSGPMSAKQILRDPGVEFAILECARGGILRSGLGFDKCDISIITNITEDHLGMDGIDSLDDLTKVKSTVAESTKPDGYAILNADNDLTYDLKNNLTCNIVLFSQQFNTDRIQEHIITGGLAVIIKNSWINIASNKELVPILHLNDIPITFNGKCGFMIENVLAATAAAMVSGFLIENIKEGLKTFTSDCHSNPGRMNTFKLGSVKLLLDYAHNLGAYSELKKYLDTQISNKKIGIIAGMGDRRDKDTIELGKIAAQIFDEIIIRHDVDCRGRTQEELSSLLLRGIRLVKPNLPVNIISEEENALNHVIQHAPEGAIIFLSSDKVTQSLIYVNNWIKNKYK